MKVIIALAHSTNPIRRKPLNLAQLAATPKDTAFLTL